VVLKYKNNSSFSHKIKFERTQHTSTSPSSWLVVNLAIFLVVENACYNIHKEKDAHLFHFIHYRAAMSSTIITMDFSASPSSFYPALICA
jgi:hypothetical protein